MSTWEAAIQLSCKVVLPVDRVCNKKLVSYIYYFKKRIKSGMRTLVIAMHARWHRFLQVPCVFAMHIAWGVCVRQRDCASKQKNSSNCFFLKKNLRDLSFVYCCKKVQVHCGPTWYRPCFPPHGCIGPRICTPKHCEIVENVSNSEKLGRKGDKVKCTLPE